MLFFLAQLPLFTPSRTANSLNLYTFSEIFGPSYDQFKLNQLKNTLSSFFVLENMYDNGIKNFINFHKKYFLSQKMWLLYIRFSILIICAFWRLSICKRSYFWSLFNRFSLGLTRFFILRCCKLLLVIILHFDGRA